MGKGANEARVSQNMETQETVPHWLPAAVRVIVLLGDVLISFKRSKSIVALEQIAAVPQSFALKQIVFLESGILKSMETDGYT